MPVQAHTATHGNISTCYSLIYVHVCTHFLITSTCAFRVWEFILLGFSRVTNSCVCSKHRIWFLFCSLTNQCSDPLLFILPCKASVPAMCVSTYACLRHRQAGFCKHNLCLKHLWPTDLSEQHWEKNNKDANPGNAGSPMSVGHAAYCSIYGTPSGLPLKSSTVSPRNISAKPTPRSEEEGMVYSVNFHVRA